MGVKRQRILRTLITMTWVIFFQYYVALSIKLQLVLYAELKANMKKKGPAWK